jgi:hypothetical protein
MSITEKFMSVTVFKPSEFAIINADAHSDFDIEKRLSVKDQKDRKIDLRLNYVYEYYNLLRGS